MQYFTLSEYIIGAISFLVLGLILSLAFSVIYKCFDATEIFFKNCCNIAKLKASKQIKTILFESYIRADNRKQKKNIFADIILSLFFFISVTLFNYYFFDGVLRLFPLVFTLIGFLLTSTFFKVLVSRAWSALVFIPKTIFFYLLYFVLKPIKAFVRLVIKLLCLISLPLYKIMLNIFTKYL